MSCPKAVLLKSGFSLVEIIVVISLFAITSVLVTTSYISYEAREKVKNAALQVKSDLRLAQNNAQTGNKVMNSVPSAGCRTPNDSLLGWYATFDKTVSNNTSYTIVGACLVNIATPPVSEQFFGSKLINLPTDVEITNITVGGVDVDKVSVFFRPLDYTVSFHNNVATIDPSGAATIDFINDTTGVPVNTISGSTVLLEFSSNEGSYSVEVNSSGKIEEKK